MVGAAAQEGELRHRRAAGGLGAEFDAVQAVAGGDEDRLTLGADGRPGGAPPAAPSGTGPSPRRMRTRTPAAGGDPGQG